MEMDPDWEARLELEERLRPLEEKIEKRLKDLGESHDKLSNHVSIHAASKFESLEKKIEELSSKIDDAASKFESQDKEHGDNDVDEKLKALKIDFEQHLKHISINDAANRFESLEKKIEDLSSKFDDATNKFESQDKENGDSDVDEKLKALKIDFEQRLKHNSINDAANRFESLGKKIEDLSSKFDDATNKFESQDKENGDSDVDEKLKALKIDFEQRQNNMINDAACRLGSLDRKIADSAEKHSKHHANVGKQLKELKELHNELRSDVDKNLAPLQSKVEEHEQAIDAAVKTYGETMKALDKLLEKTKRPCERQEHRHASPRKTQKDSDSEYTMSADPRSCQSDLGVDVSELREWYYNRIREIYEVHRPEKLPGLDKFLDKKVGKEEQTYRTICKKYNESSEPFPRYASPETAKGC